MKAVEGVRENKEGVGVGAWEYKKRGGGIIFNTKMSHGVKGEAPKGARIHFTPHHWLLCYSEY